MKPTARIAVALLLLCAVFLSGCQANGNGKTADVTTPQGNTGNTRSRFTVDPL